ncbi:MAG: ATP-binding protein [Candidatus Saccharimonadales bacterium]
MATKKTPKKRTKRVISSAKKLAHNVVSVVAPNAELERERLTSLINSMADGVLAVDEKGKIVMSNGAALNILDSNSSLRGKHIRNILKLHDALKHEVDIQQVIADAKTQYTNRDWLLGYDDGSAINLYISIAPVRLGYGQEGMKGHVILIRDITREKSLEEERDEFISVISHELRTPIAIAEGNIGNAQYIFEKPGANMSSIKEALEQAHTQIDFLSGMINDLATLSRAERDTLKLDVESINAHELIEDLARSHNDDAEAKGLTLRTNIDSRLELLKSSKLYVREILQNFITNAIKYTEHGSVTIGAKSKRSGVEFYVEDTGIGVSKPDQDKIFDKFFRSEDYRTRVNNGTGLGLYVTTKLANLVHAKISLESELNKGSTFTIFIPNL